MESIISPLLKYKCFAFVRQHTLSSRHFSGRFKKNKTGNFSQEGSSQDYHVKIAAQRCWHNQNFKHKYRKLLICYSLARMNSVNGTATEIIKGFTILKVIEWIRNFMGWCERKDHQELFWKVRFGNPNVVINETVNYEFGRFGKNLVLT